jgi:hypothetical protein
MWRRYIRLRARNPARVIRSSSDDWRPNRTRGYRKQRSATLDHGSSNAHTRSENLAAHTHSGKRPTRRPCQMQGNLSVCNDVRLAAAICRDGSCRQARTLHPRCRNHVTLTATVVNSMPEKNREKRDRKQTDSDAGQEATPTEAPKRTHESGYGGRGGEPRTSSDQREPLEPTGQEPA